MVNCTRSLFLSLITVQRQAGGFAPWSHVNPEAVCTTSAHIPLAALSCKGGYAVVSLLLANTKGCLYQKKLGENLQAVSFSFLVFFFISENHVSSIGFKTKRMGNKLFETLLVWKYCYSTLIFDEGSSSGHSS